MNSQKTIGHLKLAIVALEHDDSATARNQIAHAQGELTGSTARGGQQRSGDGLLWLLGPPLFVLFIFSILSELVMLF